MDSPLDKLRKLLEKEKLDAVFISTVANIIYLTGFSNFSVEERSGYVLITKDEQYIITSGLYSEAIKKEVPHFKLLEYSLKNPISQILENLEKKHQIKKIGIEENNLTVSEYKRLLTYFKKTENFSLLNLRAIKTPEEMVNIEQACRIGDLGFSHILKKIKIGVTEQDIADELLTFFKKKGATFSFSPIVAFGTHSSVPHHQTGQTKLEKKDGQFILLDFGVKYKNYCSDMTRTIAFGKPSARQKKIHQTVLEAQGKSVEFLEECIKGKKQIKASLIDKTGRDYINKKGLPAFTHASHGIGLEVHELPRLGAQSDDFIEPGMVFSIEPGIYYPGFGGVRIEDLFVREGETLKKLTQAPQAFLEL